MVNLDGILAVPSLLVHGVHEPWGVSKDAAHITQPEGYLEGKATAENPLGNV